MGSIPYTLFMMGKTDEALGTVQDALYVAKDLLVPAEYKLFEKEMMVLVNQACFLPAGTGFYVVSHVCRTSSGYRNFRGTARCLKSMCSPTTLDPKFVRSGRWVHCVSQKIWQCTECLVGTLHSGTICRRR